ncbi:hypothetical protein SAMN05192574_10960 [Mucilaginibacter gossypiicola]|uniref:YdhG-like domain-containing protein n=1 Tax=Mucilaginibacter gossypiicola TaxID=551995 RepID=A0A1H8QLY9_9SPHI|nr:hypothetical protein [Mucilaginibacter gossypiicola]SEO55249.1 hypothetical protein SAMN05192574_10960 [Mucilaginibacter gossypiicola]
MPKEEVADLLFFLRMFPSEVRERALWLRDFVWDLYPQANELIYDNYNALAVGWSPTEKMSHIFCSFAIYRGINYNTHFGFYWGSELSDPQKLLIGEGRQYRYLLVNDVEAFPQQEIKKLVDEAWQNSLAKVKEPKQITQGKTIVKMVSDNKREKKLKAPKN